MDLPTIYPITDTRITDLSHPEQVKRLVDGGARLIQLREKHQSSIDFYKDAARALEIAKTSDTKILINDRVDIAMILGAAGVHLGQNDLPPIEARKLLGNHALIGYSTHSEKQALEATRMPIDYIAVGPIFETSSKENPDPVVGVDGLRRIRNTVGDFPLVAIGGITQENCKDVLAAGADSVALISALLSDPPNIARNYMELAEKTVD